MAAAALNHPGTEAGPCKEFCEHLDCAATRRMASTICPGCSEPIGYGKRFYDISPVRNYRGSEDAPQKILVHEVCYPKVHSHPGVER